MANIIETERLSLREFLLEDAGMLYELNSDPEVTRFTGDTAFDSHTAAREFLKNYDSYSRNGYGRWAVILRETGRFAGWCGLKYHEDGFTDLGFRFFRTNWNQGYATEAARACLDYAFNTLGLKEIVGRTAKANHASIRVLEKLNMTFWKEGSCEGIPDALYYRITPDGFHDGQP